MKSRGTKTPSLRRVTVVVAVLVLVAVACDPGKVTPVAGTGAAGTTGDGGPATSATFEAPGGIVAIPGGGYYVVDDTACVIRKVDAAGTITTIAGNGTCGYTGDGGPATSAEIKPSVVGSWRGGLALDGDGNLYLSDAGNEVIRRIDTAGDITTVATSPNPIGYCGDLTVVPDGTIYVQCGGSVKQIATDGTVTSIFTGRVEGLTSDVSGTLYVSIIDSGGDSKVGTLATNGTFTLLVDFSVVGGFTGWNNPSVFITHLAVDASGNLFGTEDRTWSPSFPPPADMLGGALYRLGSGTAVQIAGDGFEDYGTTAQSGYGSDLSVSPGGLTVDDAGQLLYTSSHVVYRLADPADAQPWSGSACNPADVHAGTDLSGLDLQGVRLAHCDLTGVDLSGTDLTGANLSHSLLDGTDLTGTNLTGASLDGSRAIGIVGTPSALPTGWALRSGFLVGPDADLNGVDLTGVDLTGVDLAGANLQSTTFTNANLTSADLTDADLSSATLVHATMNHAILTGADFNFADFTRLRAGAVVGTPKHLPSSWAIYGSFLLGPDANATGFDMTGANLTGANLSGANLSYSNLTNTDLIAVDLSTTTLTSTNFTGATGTPYGGSTAAYDNTTCPDVTVATSPATCVGHGFAS